tara:strand:- start:209 stop:517 length:309 start_codon:yes stop_codon:yes gene_type:complete
MTTTWKIAQLDRELADGYVYTVHYTVDATDGTYSTGAYGSVELEKPETLVPYKDLKSDTVVGWVKDKLNSENSDSVKNIEAALAANIAEQKTPTKGSGLPWS